MKKKILIIEDDKDTLEILAYLTEELDIDFELRSGVIPLSQIKEINPALILLDHWVENGYGGDLCRQIKDDPDISGIPVVLVSAHDRIREVADTNSANDYLAKPFEVEDIQQIIRQYTDSR